MNKMKITKETLKRIIKEEYDAMQSEATKGPATYDNRGEYAGQGPAGGNIMSNFNSEEVKRVFPLFKKRIEALVKQHGPDKFKRSLRVIQDVEQGRQIDMEDEFLILGVD